MTLLLRTSSWRQYLVTIETACVGKQSSLTYVLTVAYTGTLFSMRGQADRVSITRDSTLFPESQSTQQPAESSFGEDTADLGRLPRLTVIPLQHVSSGDEVAVTK